MGTFFLWCCRRRQRTLQDYGSSEEEEEGKEGQAGRSPRQTNVSSWFSGKQTKKKGKTGKEKSQRNAEGRAQDDSLGDLSVVKRETEVLKSYQRPPPPKNRARASRVPRALKAENADDGLTIFESLNENNSASARLLNSGSRTESTTPISSQHPDVPNKSSAETGDSQHADGGGDAQNDLTRVKIEAGSKSSDHKEPEETVPLEPVVSVSQEAESSETPQTEDVSGDDKALKLEPEEVSKDAKPSETLQMEDTISENVDEKTSEPETEEVSTEVKSLENSQAEDLKSESVIGETVKPEPEEAHTQQAEESIHDDATHKPEAEKIYTEQLEDTVASVGNGDVGGSEKPQDVEPSREQMKDDVPSDKSSDGGSSDDSGEEDGGKTSVLTEQEWGKDAEQPEVSADVQSVASSAGADEGGISKVSLRPVSCTYPSSASGESVSDRGKRFLIPSVHGDGMGQLLQSLQTRLKEDGIPVRPDLKASEQMNTDTEDNEESQGKE